MTKGPESRHRSAIFPETLEAQVDTQGREKQRDSGERCFAAEPTLRRARVCGVWARGRICVWISSLSVGGAGGGWAEGRCSCPTALVSGGGEAPEGVASHSTGCLALNLKRALPLLCGCSEGLGWGEFYVL